MGETGRAREERETQKGETKWIRIKDRREEWKRETSKLLRENGVWHWRERGKETQDEAKKELRVLLLIKKLTGGLS